MSTVTPDLPLSSSPSNPPPLSPRSMSRNRALAMYADALQSLAAEGLPVPSSVPLKRDLFPASKEFSPDSKITLLSDSDECEEGLFFPDPVLSKVSSPSTLPPPVGPPRVSTLPSTLVSQVPVVARDDPLPTSPLRQLPRPGASHSITQVSSVGPLQARIDPKLIPLPKLYSGDDPSPSALADFRDDLTSLLELQGLDVHDPSHAATCVTFTIQYLSSHARAGARDYIAPSFPALIRCLCDDFVSPTAEEEAQAALVSLKQRSTPMQAHITAFRTALRLCAVLPDAVTLLRLFKTSLNAPCVAFYTPLARASPPLSLAAAYRLAGLASTDAAAFLKLQTINPPTKEKQRAVAAPVVPTGGGRGGRGGGRPQPPQNPAPRPGAPPSAPLPPFSIPTPCSDPAQFASLPPLPKLSVDYKAFLGQHRLCYRCQGTVAPAGHMGNNCPRFPAAGTPRLATLLPDGASPPGQDPAAPGAPTAEASARPPLGTLSAYDIDAIVAQLAAAGVFEKN